MTEAQVKPWEWIRRFVAVGLGPSHKNLWMSEPVALDGVTEPLAVATDAAIVVAVEASDTGLAPPTCRAETVAHTRRLLAIPETGGVAVDYARLLAWSNEPAPPESCSRCKGIGITNHVCPCGLCTTKTEDCDSCDGSKPGRLLDGVIQRKILAKLLSSAPATDRLAIHWIPCGDKNQPDRFLIVGDRWRATVGSMVGRDVDNLPTFATESE